MTGKFTKTESELRVVRGLRKGGRENEYLKCISGSFWGDIMFGIR